jgi:hypothetical protein
MASKIRLSELKAKLKSDPTLRAQLTQKISAALKEIGIDDADLSALEHGGSREHVELVFVSTSDAHKNHTSIIVF